jgi:hypothetical protein
LCLAIDPRRYRFSEQQTATIMILTYRPLPQQTPGLLRRQWAVKTILQAMPGVPVSLR